MGSSIPTNQYDGDVSVGRNAAVGGNAKVSGNMRVGHNLTVDGWIEAKNIKGPNKDSSRQSRNFALRTPFHMTAGGRWWVTHCLRLFMSPMVGNGWQRVSKAVLHPLTTRIPMSG